MASGRRGLREKLRRPDSARELLAARVTAILLATVAIDLAVAVAFYFLERRAPGTQVTSYGDALFWTSSQMSTVSSSLANPITGGGRVLAVALDFISVAFISLLFGSIAQHLHFTTTRKQRHFRDEAEGPSGTV
jgi:hypothetical protein